MQKNELLLGNASRWYNKFHKCPQIGNLVSTSNATTQPNGHRLYVTEIIMIMLPANCHSDSLPTPFGTQPSR